MADARPNIDEYGRGAAYTPGGMAVGCAVCSTGDVELRLKKAIPRLSDGTPNMHALGDIRAAIVHDNAALVFN